MTVSPGSSLLPSAARSTSGKRSIFYSFVFNIFRIPIFTTPLFSHLSALPYSFFPNLQIPRPQCSGCDVFSVNSFVVSSLPALYVSCRSFRVSFLLFSVLCGLFLQNTRVGILRLQSRNARRRTVNVCTLGPLPSVYQTCQFGSVLSVVPWRSSPETQRGRGWHIQLSLPESAVPAGSRSQVYG